MKDKIVKIPGIKELWNAFFLLKDHRELWKYCWVQVVLTTLVFILGWHFFDSIYGYFRELFPTLTTDYNYKTDESSFFIAIFKLLWSYIIKSLAWIIDLFLWFFTVFLIYKVGLSLLAILASPFNDSLSSRVETLIKSSTKPIEDPNILESIKIAAITETQRLLVFIAIFVPLYLFSFFVPGVGQAVLSVLTPLYSAYWLSYDSQVYAMDRRKWPMGQRIKFIGKYPVKNGLMGGGMFVVLFIPILHFMAMPLFVTAGTMNFVECEAEEASQGNIQTNS